MPFLFQFIVMSVIPKYLFVFFSNFLKIILKRLAPLEYIYIHKYKNTSKVTCKSYFYNYIET